MSPRPAVADRPACILIVDDERHNRELLQVMLEAEGYAFLMAASGEEALALVAQQAPDLILLDIVMPGIDGYQVTAKVKGDVATRNIPVVLVTALDDRNARMLGLSAGVEDFLTKPVDRAELIVRVRNLLHLKAATEELKAALTEAREARLVADKANSAKTLFLRAMSHELRTPLNAITGYTQLLELGIRGEVNPAQIQDLGRIKRAAAYLTLLINDVLTVARLEGARPLHLIPIAVNPVLAEVEGLCALDAKEKGLKLTATACEPEILVTADAERFQQILLNLITNAVKFTPKGGSIGVTCDGDGEVVQFRVKDTGVGVRLVDIDRVFEPFVQIDRHLTNAARQGVGLGLSISRELARAMHGDLTLQSTEGVGSTFTLTLPTAAETSLRHGPRELVPRGIEYQRSNGHPERITG
jgi:signal transduction histidine kinase